MDEGILCLSSCWPAKSFRVQSVEDLGLISLGSGRFQKCLSFNVLKIWLGLSQATYFPIKYRVRTERRALFRRSPLGLEGFGFAPKPLISDIYCQACVLLVQVCVRIVQGSDLEPSSEHQI